MAGPQHSMHTRLHHGSTCTCHASCLSTRTAGAHAAPSHLLPCADSAGGSPTRLDDLTLQLSTAKAACTERGYGGRLAGTCRPCQRGGEESGVWCVGLLLLARLIISIVAHHLTDSEVGAKICGIELGAMYSGTEVPTTSTPPRMSYCARPSTSEPRSVAPRRVTSTP